MFERFTDRARRVVVTAQEEARRLDHNYIGTEHILLGLLREGEGVAAQVIVRSGPALGDVRIRIIELLGDPAPVAPPTGPGEAVERSLKAENQLLRSEIDRLRAVLELLSEAGREEPENDDG